MHWERFKQRLLARATSFPEVAYAVSRHWFAVLLFFVLGTAALLAKVMLEDTFYEGATTLHMDGSIGVVVEQSGAQLRSRGDSRDGSQQSAAPGVHVLTSDSVLRKVIETLKEKGHSVSTAIPAEASANSARGSLLLARQWFLDQSRRLGYGGEDDHSEEALTQRGVASLRDRARVTPDWQSGTVSVTLLGTDRDVLLEELTTWIEVYRGRLEELARLNRQSFTDSRTRFWQQREDEAREKLIAFQKENPDVSKATQDMLIQENTQLYIRKTDMEKWIELGEGIVPILPSERGAPGAEHEELARQKAELVSQLSQAQTQFGMNSERARSLGEAVEIIDAKLSSLLQNRVAGLVGGAGPGRRAEIEEQVQKLSTQIEQNVRRLTALSVDLERKQLLEDDLRVAQQTRKSYQLMQFEGEDLAAARSSVQVQVTDGPYVSQEPLSRHSELKVALGALGGLLVGVLYAMAREVLRERVRFKNDILTEFAVPVVSVIPRR